VGIGDGDHLDTGKGMEVSKVFEAHHAHADDAVAER
jgi:hypothetical protein